MLVELNEKNFLENIKNGLKLVEFYANWCSHCKRQEKVLKEMKDIWIGKVNSDRESYLVQKEQVMGFPTFILFKDGVEVHRFSGFHEKHEIMSILTNYI